MSLFTGHAHCNQNFVFTTQPVLAKPFTNNDCTKYFSDTDKIMTSSFTRHECCNQNL